MKRLKLVTSGDLTGIRGTVDFRGVTQVLTVFAPTQGKPLPTKTTAFYPGHRGRDGVVVSRWNEPVHAPVPKNAVPIEVITGG